MSEEMTHYKKYKKTYQKYAKNHKKQNRLKTKEWKLKQKKNGRCTICGKTPIVAYSKCLKHTIQHRESERKRMGRIERYHSKTYDYEDSLKNRCGELAYV